MIRNYFKVAWRNLKRNKIYSAINILGLAAGMSVSLLIGLWVYYQYSYDKFLPNHDSVFRVQRNFDSNGDTLTFSSVSLKLSDVLKAQVPEIEYVAECDGLGSHGLMVGDKKFFMNGGQTGLDFLRVFKFPLLQGSVNTVFKDPYSIVLTESTAKALFGTSNAMNKTVRYDNRHELRVTGILKDLPSNSSMQFHYLVPITYLEQTRPDFKNEHNSFSENSKQIYVSVKPGIAFNQVSARIRNIEHTETGNSNAMKSFVILQPMVNWHLYGNYINGKETPGFLDYVRMFTLIGILVLLIACINFINLTTARSEKRAKEVGVRKAIGSQRKDLIIQFLAESFLLTFISFLFSLLFVQLSIPAFNTLTRTSLRIPFSNVYFWLLIIGAVLLTALFAGSRPAFYLSSFQPVKVLKGNLVSARSAGVSRKILVVLQFSCSIALIISTIIIYRQVNYAKTRPTGYSLNRLMITYSNEDLDRNYTALKNELKQAGVIEQMTTATSPATDIWWHSDLQQWPGKHGGETVEMGTVIVSGDYFETLGIPIKNGSNFKDGQDTTSVIFNETAIKRLRIQQPISQHIIWDTTRTIVGVAGDALMISPFSPVDPTMFVYDYHPQGVIIYRLSSKISTQDAIEKLTATFNKYCPAYPYSYEFADANYASKFNLEILIGKLSGLFAMLAIIISCLGLFGLAAYIAEQRTKEIGIRKVLGASVSQLWLLLSKDFILLVLISCLVATPIAFYFLHNWLLKYDYRISIGAGVFIVAAAMALVITLATISFQAIKSAVANPVRSLRSE